MALGLAAGMLAAWPIAAERASGQQQPSSPQAAPVSQSPPATAAAPPAAPPTTAPAGTVLNALCPVMTSEPALAEFVVEYDGRRVAFCCGICIRKFTANPQRYLARLPQFASAGEASGGTRDASAPSATPAQPAALAASSETLDVGTSVIGTLDQPDLAEEERPALLGRLHPVIVHFPLAGAPLALLAWVLWRVSGARGLALADVPPLLAATLASVMAVISGNVAEQSTAFGASLQPMLERHEQVGTATMIALLLLSGLRAWCLRWQTRVLHGIYAAGLFLVCAGLGWAGFLGGGLVHGPDHLGW